MLRMQDGVVYTMRFMEQILFPKIDGATKVGSYNPIRGDIVIAFAKEIS